MLGIDEAGRGPLAGPLAVAGVILPPDYENPQIYDSKALSEKTREKLYDEIREVALYFEILLVSEADIDRLDIYHEAIRPTNLANDPEKIKTYLSSEQYRLYKLIYARALASQMAPARVLSMSGYPAPVPKIRRMRTAGMSRGF